MAYPQDSGLSALMANYGNISQGMNPGQQPSFGGGNPYFPGIPSMGQSPEYQAQQWGGFAPGQLSAMYNPGAGYGAGNYGYGPTPTQSPTPDPLNLKDPTKTVADTATNSSLPFNPYLGGQQTGTRAGDMPPRLQAVTDFLNNEEATPGARDARMQKVQDMMGMVIPGNTIFSALKNFFGGYGTSVGNPVYSDTKTIDQTPLAGGPIVYQTTPAFDQPVVQAGGPINDNFEQPSTDQAAVINQNALVDSNTQNIANQGISALINPANPMAMDPAQAFQAAEAARVVSVPQQTEAGGPLDTGYRNNYFNPNQDSNPYSNPQLGPGPQVTSPSEPTQGVIGVNGYGSESAAGGDGGRADGGRDAVGGYYSNGQFNYHPQYYANGGILALMRNMYG